MSFCGEGCHEALTGRSFLGWKTGLCSRLRGIGGAVLAEIDICDLTGDGECSGCRVVVPERGGGLYDDVGVSDNCSLA